MTLQDAIQAVIDGQDLTADDMTAVMKLIMTGEATAAQIGGFLVGLRMKGETVDEIAAAASVMRELASPVNIEADHLVDIVGTGGDGAHTFNISTACTFVVAAAGGHVAKHGNRSVSSRSGSADLLEAAGVNLQLTPDQVAACIRDIGVGFMFAPLHHSAMKHAIGPRKEMGVRTIFNILGPLTNPASVPNLLLGVFSQALVEPLAQVLKSLGCQHVMVVHSEDGLDEISIGAATYCAELKGGEITTFTMTPSDFGIPMSSLELIKVESPEQSLSMIQAAFNNESGPALDAIVLNAGAAIYVAGLAPSLADGITRARAVIADGGARQRLAELASRTQALASS
ncbi:MAG TPA: anthranilate phosphoribosyltransferase [Gammaproteobacteria bacterium]|nr:anthranilate phosphoribosyltransferase [Gammaproteobacteria bacterium]